MTSPIQIAANQVNSLKSTGPKTEAGKKTSSLNAVRHGLTGQTVVLPEEDMAAYLISRKRYFDYYQPATPPEEDLVISIVDLRWRLQRCTALENGLYALGLFEAPGEVEASDSQIHTVVTNARTLREQTDAIKTLGMHEQRLKRMFDRDIVLLQKLQEERKAQESVAMEEAAQISIYKQKRSESWDPSENGFVFAIPEIDRYIAHKDLLAKVHAALPNAVSRYEVKKK